MAQIIATVIFLVMFLLIISEKLERHIVTLLSGLLTLVLVFGVCMHLSLIHISEPTRP
mgnify:CR=1 FL=1